MKRKPHSFLNIFLYLSFCVFVSCTGERVGTEFGLQGVSSMYRICTYSWKQKIFSVCTDYSYRVQIKAWDLNKWKPAFYPKNVRQCKLLIWHDNLRRLLTLLKEPHGLDSLLLAIKYQSFSSSSVSFTVYSFKFFFTLSSYCPCKVLFWTFCPRNGPLLVVPISNWPLSSSAPALPRKST